MIFNSLEFLVFLPLVLLLYSVIPAKFRWVLLLLASYYFYMAWRAEYIFLIVFSTLAGYGTALAIQRSEDQRSRKGWLVLCLLLNLGLLAVFKYYGFFNSIAGNILPGLDLLLPVGISFYTFQILGYTIDVYRGRLLAERHIGRFALFVTFFPQLVAGPIERAGNLLPQMREFANIRFDGLREGLPRIVFGLFKKVVIADRLATLVNTVYAAPELFNGPQLLLATVFFAFQIYLDFSAYSDIAIGVARILGVRLMENFDRPYLSRSLTEFWSRWHISLSTWFRDYLYISLGGNRKKPLRVGVNLLVTFLVSGLWHGASWTFVIWGLYHGLIVAFERFTIGKKREERRWFHPLSLLRWLLTFVLVLVGWVFFRAENLADVGVVLSGFFSGYGDFNLLRDFQGLGLNKTFFAWSCLMVLAVFVIEFIDRHGNLGHSLTRRPVLGAACVQVAAMLILLMGVLGGESQFIYFQF